ncbi:unnamed protein product [Lepeophtheirus salmonis]|uniref:(salmon louse) hypothetical protein n=1 Tax=Lepeophtheirus salmonis TaxID=72036 RepID=A0A7R8CGR0_LEPSM|nr:unnamed protein product [Lepeophtheirus salmonis]CAF2818080.1 unnamed protein product [Lepeophtheirus salmonis]
MNKEEKVRAPRTRSHNCHEDSNKEEATVVEYVKAAESSTKLNKNDQCFEDERNGEYASTMKTSEEQSWAILDINKSSAKGRPFKEDWKMVLRNRSYFPKKICAIIKSRK